MLNRNAGSLHGWPSSAKLPQQITYLRKIGHAILCVRYAFVRPSEATTC
jgi:hypothetical protein